MGLLWVMSDRYFSRAFACALHSWLAAAAPYGASCAPWQGPGTRLGISLGESQTSQQGKFYFPHSFTHWEQVFHCYCSICNPITMCVTPSHPTAGHAAFWIAHSYCNLHAKFPQEKQHCDTVAFFRLNSLSFKLRRHWSGALTQHCFSFLSVFKSPSSKLSPFTC